MMSAYRRSPRPIAASRMLWSMSWNLNWRNLAFSRLFSSRMSRLACSKYSRGLWANQPKGVCGLGTNQLTVMLILPVLPSTSRRSFASRQVRSTICLHVVERLAGQADHEVQLELLPAGFVRLLDGREQVAVLQGLVDDLPEPLAGGFHGDGQAALSHRGEQLGHELQLLIDAAGWGSTGPRACPRNSRAAERRAPPGAGNRRSRGSAG